MIHLVQDTRDKEFTIINLEKGYAKLPYSTWTKTIDKFKTLSYPLQYTPRTDNYIATDIDIYIAEINKVSHNIPMLLLASFENEEDLIHIEKTHPELLI